MAVDENSSKNLDVEKVWTDVHDPWISLHDPWISLWNVSKDLVHSLGITPGDIRWITCGERWTTWGRFPHCGQPGQLSTGSPQPVHRSTPPLSSGKRGYPQFPQDL